MNGRQATPGTGLNASIRPAALPGSTFVDQGPSRVNTGWGDLANAFASLSPTLQKMAAKDKEKDDNYATIQSAKSLPDFRKAVAESPERQRQAMNIVLGQKEAAEWSLSLTNSITNEFNPDGEQSLDQFIADKQQAHLATLGDEYAQASFVRTSAGFVGQIKDGHKKYQAGVVRGKLADGVMVQARGAIEASMSEYNDPVKAANSIANVLTDNKQMLNMTAEEQEGIVLKLMTEAAQQGKPELVSALYRTSRGGVGSIEKGGKYIGDYEKLIDGATTEASRNFNEGNYEPRVTAQTAVLDGTFHRPADFEAFKAKYPNIPQAELDDWRLKSAQIEEGNRQRLADKEAKLQLGREHAARVSDVISTAYADASTKGGTVFRPRTVPNKAGDGTDEVSVETQKKEVEARQQVVGDRVEQEFGKDDPAKGRAVRMDHDVRFFTKNPTITNTRWEDTFSNLGVDATADIITKGEVPQRVQDAVQLYTQLRENNPALAQTHIKDKDSANFLDRYYALRQAKMNDIQALTAVAQWQDKVRQGVDMSNIKPLKDTEITTHLSEVRDTSTWNPTSWFGKSYTPTTADMGVLRQRIKVYQELGMDPKSATASAATWMTDTHRSVNGRAVYVGSRALPKEFPKLAEELLDHVAVKYGEQIGIKNGSSLFIRPVTEGSASFQVMTEDYPGGIPVPVTLPSGKPLYFTTKDIANREAWKADQALAAENAAGKADGARQRDLIKQLDELAIKRKAKVAAEPKTKPFNWQRVFGGGPSVQDIFDKTPISKGGVVTPTYLK